jgi:hypothetical protein
MQSKLREKEMAGRLGVSERTLRSWRAVRIVPFIKIRKVILFDPDAVEAALRRFERKVQGHEKSTKQAEAV